jgi:hypothetical protein
MIRQKSINHSTMQKKNGKSSSIYHSSIIKDEHML